MIGYIASTWSGWLDFVGYTKIVGLFFVIVIALWLMGIWQKKGTFFVASVLCTVLCLIPFSAAVLQVYQTPFYEYSWIWALVPMIPFLAYGATEIYGQLWVEKKLPRQTRILMTGMGVLICVLCISFTGPGMQETSKKKAMEETKQVLETVAEYGDDILQDELTLWAPKEIISYARMFAPQIRLYYGRDMWQKELDVFTDDRYSEKQQEDFAWMEASCQAAATEPMSGVGQLQQAVLQGVNVIMFDKNTGEDLIQELEQFFSVEAGKIRGYYVFFMTPDMIKRYEQ